MVNKRLIELRNILKISQAKLARPFNVSTTFLAEIEKGHRPLQSFMLDEIVSIYNVRKKWLYQGVLPIFNDEVENNRIANTIDLAVNIKNQLGDMTLQELAIRMDITYPAMRGIMSTGRCSQKRLEKISEILNVATSEFSRTLDNQLIREKKSIKQPISIGDNSKLMHTPFQNQQEYFTYKEKITKLLKQVDTLSVQNWNLQQQITELSQEIKSLYLKLPIKELLYKSVYREIFYHTKIKMIENIFLAETCNYTDEEYQKEELILFDFFRQKKIHLSCFDTVKLDYIIEPKIQAWVREKGSIILEKRELKKAAIITSKQRFIKTSVMETVERFGDDDMFYETHYFTDKKAGLAWLVT